MKKLVLLSVESYGLIGDLYLEADVTLYLGNEMREFYLTQAYKSYNSNNLRTATK